MNYQKEIRLEKIGVERARAREITSDPDFDFASVKSTDRKWNDVQAPAIVKQEVTYVLGFQLTDSLMF